ncbi:phage protein [Streptococcus pneumoniae]|uniref:DUF1642 domain-containing protein n=1 Tax=Streptococcus pneumoniae TaxID=1313 RepID=UPI000765588A|nr:DUF1642 domain-containing protein [Streptococcus pneumoniae]CVW56746.1 phage protein [Streptococcus pneumoniae]VLE09556.1 phage protein [Streptococcus pneumoniae]VNO05709.1 phage protein [Streptococcus pneumoniae]
MNKQELIKKLEERRTITGNFQGYVVWWKDVKEIFEQLDESEIGHADEAPRYVKNILARLRELPLHDREVWLKAIMSEFEQDFSRAKWREGYEQGKIEGMVEREKVIVPQFVADWIEVCKEHLTTSLYTAMTPNFMKENNQSFDLILWIKKASNQDLFARAWLDGYEVEKEKRYFVKIKGNIKENMLVYGELLKRYFFTKSFSSDDVIYSHTRKELEDANFGWVFDCPGIEIEEVE